MDYINIYELTAKKKLSVKQAIEQMGVSESTYFRIKRKLKQLGLGDSEKLSQSILFDSQL
jgi:ACT domain-containing protein